MTQALSQPPLFFINNGVCTERPAPEFWRVCRLPHFLCLKCTGVADTAWWHETPTKISSSHTFQYLSHTFILALNTPPPFLSARKATRPSIIHIALLLYNYSFRHWNAHDWCTACKMHMHVCFLMQRISRRCLKWWTLPMTSLSLENLPVMSPTSVEPPNSYFIRRRWWRHVSNTSCRLTALASCLIYAWVLLEYVNLIVWVRSVNKMLPSVKFKVLTFLILHEKC